MQCKLGVIRFFVVLCCTLFITFLDAQNKPQVADSILFVTEWKTFLVSNKSEKWYGKPFFAFNPDYFMDKRGSPRTWEYRKCGGLYGKFRKYCEHHALAYNANELKRFRKATVWNNVLIGSSVALVIPITFDALNAYFARGGGRDPFWLFKGKLGPFLIPIVAVGVTSANHLQAANKRKFKERIFRMDE